jgi:hypothetical protein
MKPPWRYVLVALVGLGVGCGGSRAEAPATRAPEPSAAPSPPAPVAEPATQELPETPAEQPPPESTADATAESGDSPRNPDKIRDIRYTAMPDALKIEVDGVRFLAKAEPVRTPNGFHVRVTVSATASEGRSLLSPKNGPLAFAGTVKRAGKSEAEPFGDERHGDGEEPLGQGTTVKLSRDFPPKGVRPLGNGDVLELDVGLWGLGTGPSDRRAVKQLARVKASVANWKGRASVSPPPALIGG